MTEYVFFVEYEVKVKGHRKLIDENSFLMNVSFDRLSIKEIKNYLLGLHNVDPVLHYVHIKNITNLGEKNVFHQTEKRIEIS